MLVSSCPSLARDARKLFEQYWLVGTDDPSQNASLPARWPRRLATAINASHPLRLRATVRNARPDGSDALNESFTVFLSVRTRHVLVTFLNLSDFQRTPHYVLLIRCCFAALAAAVPVRGPHG